MKRAGRGARRAHAPGSAPASPAPTRSTPALRGLVARAELALLATTSTSPGAVAGQGGRARRRPGGVHGRGLAGRVTARGVGDRLAAVGGAVAVQARQLGVGEGPAVLDRHERQQRLDASPGARSPAPSRTSSTRARTARRLGSELEYGVVAMRRASCAAPRGRRGWRAPRRDGPSTSAAGRSRRRRRRSPGRSSTGSAAGRRRAARSNAKTSRSSAAHSVAARQRRALHAIDRAQQLRSGALRAAPCAGTGHVERRGRGDRRAAGGRDDEQAAVGLRGHVDAARAARAGRGSTRRGRCGAIAVTLEHRVRRRVAPAQRDRLARLQRLRAARAARCPRSDGWSAFRGAEAQVDLGGALRRGRRPGRRRPRRPPRGSAAGSSGRVSGAAPAGAASASDARAPAVATTLHGGA